MSMNLTLTDEITGKDISLWQTPTWVTYICLSFNDKTKLPDGGMEGVRHRYLIWVDSHMNGVWESKEDMDAMIDNISAHKQTILAVKEPYFSWE